MVVKLELVTYPFNVVGFTGVNPKAVVTCKELMLPEKLAAVIVPVATIEETDNAALVDKLLRSARNNCLPPLLTPSINLIVPLVRSYTISPLL